MSKSILTLGPILFNWKVKDWQDFYFKMADESPVDEVYIGEVACGKREVFFEPVMDKVIERLENAGKKVHLSTLMLTMSSVETDKLKKMSKNGKHLVEANDISAVALNNGQNHIVGPYVNTYNEVTLAIWEKQGASRICLPIELEKKSIELLTKSAKSEIEIFVFGRAPLAISARCYHARLHGTQKDDCGFVCEQDYDGKVLKTLMNESFLAINGTQTMSHTYVNLAREIGYLQDIGATAFRLSPHYMDMVTVANQFRGLLDRNIEADSLISKLKPIMPDKEGFANGFFYGTQGRQQLEGSFE